MVEISEIVGGDFRPLSDRNALPIADRSASSESAANSGATCGFGPFFPLVAFAVRRRGLVAVAKCSPLIGISCGHIPSGDACLSERLTMASILTQLYAMTTNQPVDQRSLGRLWGIIHRERRKSRQISGIGVSRPYEIGNSKNASFR
jgi:hypothetical protein